MRILRISIIFCLLFSSTLLSAQKGPLKKAQQLFKEKKYATAIPHYQKALTDKYNSSVASKLAYCYKMNNKTVEAEALYAEIVKNDSANDINYFYYAEALMSNGKYEEAKIWFGKYLDINPDHEPSRNYIKACDYSKTIPSYFDNVIIEPFSKNSEVDDNSPVFWNDGIVFTSDRKGKIKLLDEKSGWTDRDYLRMYYSKKQADGSYEEPTAFVPKLNVARKNTGMATFKADGTEMYYSRNGNYLNNQDAYCLQLYGTQSTDGHSWKGADLIDFCIKEYNYMHPAISPDGRYLFFVSDRPKGYGGADIYVSERGKNGWGNPENLGSTINTEGHEGFPFMHASGRLYFCSKGHSGFGGFDIFFTEKDKKGNWQTPVNVGMPVNSPADDISIFIDAAQENGLFTSSREGGDDDIYILQFPPTALPLYLPSAPTIEKTVTIIDSSNAVVNEEIIEQLTATASNDFPTVATTVIDNSFVNIPPLLQTNALQKGQAFLLPTLSFTTGTYLIKQGHTPELAQLAEILNQYPTLQIEIGSHTNDTNTTTQLTLLTQNRADSVRSYLSVLGIERERLTTKAYGASAPLVDCKSRNCTTEELKKNERIEVKILNY